MDYNKSPSTLTHNPLLMKLGEDIDELLEDFPFDEDDDADIQNDKDMSDVEMISPMPSTSKGEHLLVSSISSFYDTKNSSNIDCSIVPHLSQLSTRRSSLQESSKQSLNQEQTNLSKLLPIIPPTKSASTESSQETPIEPLNQEQINLSKSLPNRPTTKSLSGSNNIIHTPNQKKIVTFQFKSPGTSLLTPLNSHNSAVIAGANAAITRVKRAPVTSIPILPKAGQNTTFKDVITSNIDTPSTSTKLSIPITKENATAAPITTIKPIIIKKVSFPANIVSTRMTSPLVSPAPSKKQIENTVTNSTTIKPFTIKTINMCNQTNIPLKLKTEPTSLLKSSHTLSTIESQLNSNNLKNLNEFEELSTTSSNVNIPFSSYDVNLQSTSSNVNIPSTSNNINVEEFIEAHQLKPLLMDCKDDSFNNVQVLDNNLSKTKNDIRTITITPTNINSSNNDSSNSSFLLKGIKMAELKQLQMRKQSTIKNKIIERVKLIPRTKLRSNSLTNVDNAEKKLIIRQRRSSSILVEQKLEDDGITRIIIHKPGNGLKDIEKGMVEQQREKEQEKQQEKEQKKQKQKQKETKKQQQETEQEKQKQLEKEKQQHQEKEQKQITLLSSTLTKMLDLSKSDTMNNENDIEQAKLSLLCNEKLSLSSNSSKTSNESLDTFDDTSFSRIGEESECCSIGSECEENLNKSKDTNGMIIINDAIKTFQKQFNKVKDDIALYIAKKNINYDVIDFLKENPGFSFLKWSEKGLGASQDEIFNFELNEFGLIELSNLKNKLASTGIKTTPVPHIDKTKIPSTSKYENLNKMEDEEIDFITPTIQYNISINKRKNKYKRTSKSSDNLLFCAMCNGRGYLIDFLIPTYCSTECLKKLKSVNIALMNYEKSKKNKDNNLSKSVNISRVLRNKLFSSTIPSNLENNQKQQNTGNESNLFVWETYLSTLKVNAAPVALFFNPYPYKKNRFKEGMKLEAIDPENNSLFCACTVQQIKGYRLKLHFDGYSDKYDFWVNADSMDIFPPGWCEKTNRVLRPPRGMDAKTFSWSKYLRKTNAIGAPRSLFTHLNSPSTHVNPFKVGMRLEADDLKNTRKVCVASVGDVLNNRILVHFDGWDNCYDYWIDINSPYIHPVDWHKEHGFSIVVPPDWEKSFEWEEYIDLLQCEAAIESMFSTREPLEFKPGMRLEVVDKKNKSLIRPATILMVDEYEIKVVFDGWPSEYAFWIVDDSPDIHPINWCKITGHELEPPPGFGNLPKALDCPVPYCRGIGNANSTKIKYHANTDSCPYVIKNWLKIDDKSGRYEETEYFKPIKSQTKRKNETTVTTSKPSKIPKRDTKTTRNDGNKKDNEKHPTNKSIFEKSDSAKSKIAIEDNKNDMKVNKGDGNNINDDNHNEYDNAQVKITIEDKNNVEDKNTVENKNNAENKNNIEDKNKVENKNNVEDNNNCYETIVINDIVEDDGNVGDNNKNDDSEIINLADDDDDEDDDDDQQQQQQQQQRQQQKQKDDFNGRINISKKYLCDYGPRLKNVYKLWNLNLGFINTEIIDENKIENPLEWSVDDVCKYVEKVTESEEIAFIFYEQEIDGMAFLAMRQNDLIELLKIKLGPTIKIYNLILKLREICIMKDHIEV